MTQVEIIEMAKQVGIKRRTDEFYSEFCDGVYFDDLEAFAKLIAQHEREACWNDISIALLGSDKELTKRVFKAIRARVQA